MTRLLLIVLLTSVVSGAAAQQPEDPAMAGSLASAGPVGKMWFNLQETDDGWVCVFSTANAQNSCFRGVRSSIKSVDYKKSRNAITTCASGTSFEGSKVYEFTRNGAPVDEPVRKMRFWCPEAALETTNTGWVCVMVAGDALPTNACYGGLRTGVLNSLYEINRNTKYVCPENSKFPRSRIVEFLSREGDRAPEPIPTVRLYCAEQSYTPQPARTEAHCAFAKSATLACSAAVRGAIPMDLYVKNQKPVANCPGSSRYPGSAVLEFVAEGGPAPQELRVPQPPSGPITVQ